MMDVLTPLEGRAKVGVFPGFENPKVPYVVDVFGDRDAAMAKGRDVQELESLFNANAHLFAAERRELPLKVALHLRTQECVSQLPV
jgi:hypothetical protein